MSGFDQESIRFAQKCPAVPAIKALNGDIGAFGLNLLGNCRCYVFIGKEQKHQAPVSALASPSSDTVIRSICGNFCLSRSKPTRFSARE